MISFKVACNTSILETRNRQTNVEDGVTDMLSFKLDCNSPGKVVVAIYDSGGIWGYTRVWNRPRCNINLPEECEIFIIKRGKKCVQEDIYKQKEKKKAWT